MQRREFIETITALSGTAFMASTMPWMSVLANPTQTGAGPSDRVRIGIIGMGLRGRTLYLNLESLKSRSNLEVAAVCDIYKPHYERAVSMTDGKAAAFYDYREMLDTVPLDAVVIATPLYEHARQTVDSMQAGCHVYCEKAMARTLDDVKWMYDTHIQEDKIMLIGYQRLFNPVYLQALRNVDSGLIGSVNMLRAWWTRNEDWVFYPETGGRGSALDRQLNWRLYKEYSGGMISELGSHHFQVANWVLGAQPESVMGRGSINYWKDGREVYDNFALIFHYPGDIHFTYDCTTSNKHNGMQFQVMGSRGTMELETNKRFDEEPPPPPALRKLLHNIESSLFETIPIGGATWIPAEPVTYGGEYISADWNMDDTLLYLEGFVEFVRRGRRTPEVERLTREAYNASTWTVVAEQAAEQQAELSLPEKYII
jgi:predicted dehydrogenase